MDINVVEDAHRALAIMETVQPARILLDGAAPGDWQCEEARCAQFSEDQRRMTLPDGFDNLRHDTLRPGPIRNQTGVDLLDAKVSRSWGRVNDVIRGTTTWANGSAAACWRASTRCRIGPHCMMTMGSCPSFRAGVAVGPARS